jgi:hypothetical protein
MNFQFDSSPTIFFGLVYLLLFIWVLSAILQKPKQSDSFFLLLGSVFLFLGRLPVIFHNKSINQDESQMLTQAMTLRQEPILFQAVDTTTGGPLSSYLLTFFNLFGFRLDYASAHFVAILLIILSFVFLYKTSQNLFDTQSARLAVIPFVVFEIFTQEPDFIHFSSELVPLLLVILMLYFSSKPSKINLFLVGFFGAMCIFGKLQALPVIAVIGLISLRKSDGKQIYIDFFVKFLGGITGVIALSIFFMVWGVFQEVIDFYFIRNITAHTATRSLLDGILAFPTFIFKNIDFFIFTIASFILILPFNSFSNRIRGDSKTFILKKNWQLWIYLSVSIFSVIRTGSDYLHYLHFLIPPLVLLAANGYHSNQKSSQGKPIFSIQHLVIFSICLYYLSSFGIKTLKNQSTNLYNSQSLTQSSVSKEILKHAKSGEKLVVWGWNLDYHIETQMPQGTRENHIPYVVLPHKMQAQEQKRYLADLRKNKPKIFVDAVGKNSHWFNDKSLYQHENFAEIKEFIQKNYILVNFVDDVRIYRRR